MAPGAFVRTAFEEQEALQGKNARNCGQAPQNRKNLETVKRNAYQQGLIRKIVPLDDLFADPDLGDAAGSEEA